MKMSQTSGTVNLLIHDSQGNPQYLKIQTSQAGKTTHNTMSTIRAIPQEKVKSLLSHKSQVVATGPGSVTSNQVLRALSIGGKSKQLVTIPVQTPLHTIIKEEKSPAASPKSTSSPSIVLPTSNSKQYVTFVDSSSASKKRPEAEETLIQYDLPFNPQPVSASKRRKTEKGGKGLRHFSMKVCEKVRTKGTTSYNEVADELVAEFTNPELIPNSVDQQYDQKNIRRRVYDALNVLMAMNIISKEKKEIRWIGLPTTAAQECVSLISEKKSIAERIKSKTQQLNELLLKQISLRSLIQRNRELERTRGPPQPNTAMHLPFIVVNTDKKTEIDCSITNDKSEYQFIFNGKFEIINDIDVLKLIGLTYGLEKGTISEFNLEKVKHLIPKALESYVIKMAREPMQENGLESVDYCGAAGPSSDASFGADDSSTSDEESMASTDIELN